MNLKKNLGRIVTAFVATAMMTAMAMPVYAYEAVTEENTGSSITAEKPYQEGASFYITKYLTKDAKTMVPNAKFEFDVTPVTGMQETTRNNVPLKSGIAGAVTADATEGTAVFAPGETLDQNTKVYDKVTFNINLDAFKAPEGTQEPEKYGVGVYKYSIKEKDITGLTGITKDTNTLDLYVYIVNDDTTGDLKVAYAELVDPNGGENGGEVKMDSFTNQYDSVNNLIVYKVLTGDAADMRDEFTFDVTISGEDGEKYYVEYGTYTVDEDGTGTFTANNQTAIWTSGSQVSVKLHNNEAFKVYALDGNDTYTVTETAQSAAGYKVIIDDKESTTRQATGTLDNADKVIEFENNKTSVSPTGIVMDIAPYALLVVVAAAGCFVFLRKRRED